MTDVPFVTVLVPVRNEVADIATSLRAVLAQDHPHERMEVLLVDGGSTDGTVARATELLATGDVAWRVIDNPVGTTPSNLNAGLAVASGDVICRVDARSFVPPDYVRLCSELLADRPDVIVTGGAQVAIPPDSARRSTGIARALNNRYLMGGSRYRSGAPSGPADTVYLGAFRTEELRAVGGWDEAMLTNQDYELNRRLGQQGIVWFDDRLHAQYVPRRTFIDLWRQYHRFGRWKVRYWRHSNDAPQTRQRVRLAVAATGLVATLAIVSSGVHRSRRLCGLTVAAMSALLAVEHGGTKAPEPRGLLDRLSGVVAMCAVGGGWCVGIVREVVSGHPKARARP